MIRTELTGGEKKSLTKDTSLLKNWEKPVILVFICQAHSIRCVAGGQGYQQGFI